MLSELNFTDSVIGFPDSFAAAVTTYERQIENTNLFLVARVGVEVYWM